MQVRAGGRREQRPFATLHHALHEQVRDPVGRVHVVRAAAVVAGVLAQLQEFLDVQVPRLQVRAHRALALAALVHGHGRVVDHLQERHHALALAVGALDVRAQRAHVGPVVAQTAGELGQQRVFLERLVDAVQVVRHRGQVARRQLRAAGARVEQRRRGRHEVERRQQLVELDGARFAVDFIERQAHRHAHEERLRHLDALVADVQEVAVVQRLQAEVVELQVARGVERGAQLGQVELGQRVVQQAGVDAALDELREVIGIAPGHLGLGDFLAQDFTADRVQQDACGGLAVGRILLDQGPRGQDGRVVHLAHRHAFVQVLDGLLEDRLRIHRLAQARAGRHDQVAQRRHVERAGDAAVRHVQADEGRLLLRLARLCALLRAALAVQHIGAGDIVLARAHQGQFDLVLHILDVERAAIRTAAQQRAHHVLGQALDQLAHARGSGALPAVDGEEGLGHRHGDLGGLEADHGAVAADDLVVGVASAGGHGRALGRLRKRGGIGGAGVDFCLGRLHGDSC